MTTKEQIIYGTVLTDLGPALVARTATGVRMVRLCSPGERLVTSIEHQNDSDVVHDQAAIQDIADALRAAIQGRPIAPVPLDLIGTPFQIRVWETLCSIPAGQKWTYSDIAIQIGAASSTRAVANACGANPVAIFVPCHRAVRTDGGLGGYRWGIDKKRMLLEMEEIALVPMATSTQ